MVPGFTLRECQAAEMRRRELLAQVAAERRYREYSPTNRSRERISTALAFTRGIPARLSALARSATKPRTAHPTR